MSQFVIHGGRKLHGEVSVGGSKNAALPILAATLLTDQKCVIRNVPDIDDIHTMLAMLRSLGSEAEFKNHTVTIQTRHIRQENIDKKLGCKMRASVLLLGPLLVRTGFARLPYPGGCVLGARSISTHENVLRQAGIKRMPSKKEEIIFRGKPQAREVVLPEFSVTATENILMACSLASGESVIRLSALEPHVQDLCRFLKAMGVGVSGIGTHDIHVRGKKNLHGVTYRITPDYLEAGTLVLAALLTKGSVLVRNIIPRDLDALWNLLREMGVKFQLGKNFVKLLPSPKIRMCARLQTNVFPGFPTDLQPPFVILMTQASGKGIVHETLFEGRFSYFPDLMQMGAKIEKLNPHEAIISGPSLLKGANVKSWDIRAGAAMLLAGLAAKGKTVVRDIQYIDRGYESFDEKLRSLGADISRLD
ncbi:MAG: UDP-N-acetylglucosamine 1-carboxyvinyltransferase [Patescibacteria group bacterium]